MRHPAGEEHRVHLALERGGEPARRLRDLVAHRVHDEARLGVARLAAPDRLARVARPEVRVEPAVAEEPPLHGARVRARARSRGPRAPSRARRRRGRPRTAPRPAGSRRPPSGRRAGRRATRRCPCGRRRAAGPRARGRSARAYRRATARMLSACEKLRRSTPQRPETRATGFELVDRDRVHDERRTAVAPRRARCAIGAPRFEACSPRTRALEVGEHGVVDEVGAGAERREEPAAAGDRGERAVRDASRGRGARGRRRGGVPSSSWTRAAGRSMSAGWVSFSSRTSGVAAVERELRRARAGVHREDERLARASVRSSVGLLAPRRRAPPPRARRARSSRSCPPRARRAKG